MATTNVTIRMDEELKKQAEDLFSDLGMNMTTALTIFVKQAIREQKIPFTISRNIPNDDTLEAIAEIQRLKNSPDKKTYSSFSELLKEVEEDV
ncbi:type II toxin-antitoxin system RelB/DinJ family antitoxin [Intestinibacter sp.]|uniref:type II toxin-antitoxin system RelB/DinJ family antitoxin n=1 Tax=Intestinibacter sp. TaxID=1965304 RepID=UPI002A7607B4|nr:type II toxin-antitoxin system RelB/DinJ family antitoxin [Intestinibacter sp.]MDY2735597.1 type II toxin-antitoxin system RelB/DinJ family antitoxin [Intestinibacter sp.]